MACAALMLLAAAALVWGPATADAANTINVKGRLSVMDNHQIIKYIIATADRRIFTLPYQPLDPNGQLLTIGSFVQLTCNFADGRDRLCESISDADSFTPGGRIAGAFASAGTVNVQLSPLILVISFEGGSCARGAGYSVDQVSQFFYGATGHAKYFSDCSYGKMKFSQAAGRVLATPVQCTSGMLDDCDADAIAEAADNKAQQLLGAGAVSGFSHTVYIMPKDMMWGACGWSGLAVVPGTQTWLQSNSYGVGGKGTVMQEMLHNFGLLHSWRDGVEYQDYSTCMGYGDSCPSAYEIGRLKWASPMAELNGASMRTGALMQYTLPVTYLGPDSVYLKIRPDWLGGSAWTHNVYVALRGKGGGDVDLLDEFDRKLSVHKVDRAIDDDPANPEVLDPQVEIIAVVGSGSQFDIPQWRLLVRAGSLLEGGTKIQAWVCRYTSSSSECSGGGGGTIPTASPPPPPVVWRSPPPPPIVWRSPPPPPVVWNSQPPPPPKYWWVSPPPPPAWQRTPPPPPLTQYAPPDLGGWQGGPPEDNHQGGPDPTWTAPPPDDTAGSYACPRPSTSARTWCPPGSMLFHLDCDGDGAQDWACSGASATAYATSLSSRGCVASRSPDRDSSACVQAFDATPTRGSRCPEVGGYVTYKDLDAPYADLQGGASATWANGLVFEDISDLLSQAAGACNSNPSCGGFNSAGVLKGELSGTRTAKRTDMCLYQQAGGGAPPPDSGSDWNWRQGQGRQGRRSAAEGRTTAGQAEPCPDCQGNEYEELPELRDQELNLESSSSSKERDHADQAGDASERSAGQRGSGSSEQPGELAVAGAANGGAAAGGAAAARHHRRLRASARRAL